MFKTIAITFVITALCFLVIMQAMRASRAEDEVHELRKELKAEKTYNRDSTLAKLRVLPMEEPKFNMREPKFTPPEGIAPPKEKRQTPTITAAGWPVGGNVKAKTAGKHEATAHIESDGPITTLNKKDVGLWTETPAGGTK